jgi:hypothetical protein
MLKERWRMIYSYIDVVNDGTTIKEHRFDYDSERDLEETLRMVAWHIQYSLMPQAFLTELLYHVLKDWQHPVWLDLLESCCKYDDMNEHLFALKWYQIDRRLRALGSKEGACLAKRYQQVDEKLKEYLGNEDPRIYGYFDRLLYYDHHPRWCIFLEHLRNVIEEKSQISLRLVKFTNVKQFVVWFNRKIEVEDKLKRWLSDSLDRGMMEYLDTILEDMDGAVGIHQWMSASRKYIYENLSMQTSGFVSKIWEGLVKLNSNEKGRRWMMDDLSLRYDHTMKNVMPYWLSFGRQLTQVSSSHYDWEACIECLKVILPLVWQKEYCSECAVTLAIHSYITIIRQQDLWKTVVNVRHLMESVIMANHHLNHTISKCNDLFQEDLYALECFTIDIIVKMKQQSSYLSDDNSYLDELLCQPSIGPLFTNNTLSMAWIVKSIQTLTNDGMEIDSTTLCCLGRLLNWPSSTSHQNREWWDTMRDISKCFMSCFRPVESTSLSHQRVNLTQQYHRSIVFLAEMWAKVCSSEAEWVNQQQQQASKQNLPLTHHLLRMLSIWSRQEIVMLVNEPIIRFLTSKLQDISRPKIQVNACLALQSLLQYSSPTIHRRNVLKNCSLIECLIHEGLHYHESNNMLTAEYMKIEHSLLCILLLTRDDNMCAILRCESTPLLIALSQLVVQPILWNQSLSEASHGYNLLDDIFTMGLWYFSSFTPLDESLCKLFLEPLMHRLIFIPESQLFHGRIIDNMILLLELSFQHPTLWSAFRESFIVSQFEKKRAQMVTQRHR